MTAPGAPEATGKATDKVRFEDAENCTQATNAFLYNVRLTAGARFEAARRHKNRFRTSNLSVILLSLYAMIASTIASVSQLSEIWEQTLNIIALTMSALVIAFTLFEGSKRHDMRSELFLKSAQAFKKLHDELKVKSLSKEIDENDLLEHVNHYHDLLSQFGDNHSNIDYRLHRVAKNKESDKNKIASVKRHMFFNIWKMPALALAAPFVMVILMIGSVYFYRYFDNM